MFVNYRRDDTGWAANLLADALRQRLGSSAEVFLDNRSISLGEAFAEALEDGVRRSAVLVVLIGPRWDQPPLVGRLFDPRDWVRKEILTGSYPTRPHPMTCWCRSGRVSYRWLVNWRAIPKSLPLSRAITACRSSLFLPVTRNWSPWI